MSPRPPASADRAIGLALAMGGVLAFSLRPILIKLAYGLGAEPVTLLALRMGLSLPFFLAMALWAECRATSRLPPRLWLQVAGLGLLSYYLASFFDFLGLQYVDAGLGRLLLFLYPTIVVALSALLLKRRPQRRELAALAVTYAGVALVLARGGGTSSNLPLGAALVFGSALCYAAYLVLGSQVVARVGSLRFTAWAMIAACLASLAQFPLLRPWSALDLPAAAWGLAAVIAVVCTVLPVFMTAEALRRIGANPVALMGALGPVSAIAIGHAVLGEHLSGLQVAGAVLVTAGVLLVSARPRG